MLDRQLEADVPWHHRPQVGYSTMVSVALCRMSRECSVEMRARSQKVMVLGRKAAGSHLPPAVAQAVAYA